MEIENKEVALVKTQATKALNAANDLEIKTDEDMEDATDLLSKIKTVGKMVKTRKEAITKPLNDALASARNLFRPIEDSHEKAERIIKNKMLAYQDEKDKKAQEEMKKLADRVEKGTMKTETAVRKMSEIETAPAAVKGTVGAIRTSIVKKYRVTDESKLSREYLVPNMAKITEDLKAGKVVEGAEVYEEKVISAR